MDGETGFWFRSSDVDALAAHLVRLKDDAVAAQMGRAAYDRYWANPLTLDRHLDRIEAVYDAVLTDAGPDAPRARTDTPSRSQRAVP